MYVVLETLRILSKNIIGRAHILKNPLHAFISNPGIINYSKIYFISSNNNIAEQTIDALVKENNKMILSNGEIYDVTLIKKEGSFIIFEPDGKFDMLGTGYVRDFVNFKEFNSISQKAFLLLSSKPGPENWKYGVLYQGELDFGEIVNVTRI